MSKVNFRPELKNVVDSILFKNPSVVSSKMFGYPAYYVNKKLVACIYEEDAGIKIPENAANEVIGKKGIVHFQPLGRKRMKEWIQINWDNPEDYLKDIEIFETSISFVALSRKNSI
jgi:hypothetical protein